MQTPSRLLLIVGLLLCAQGLWAQPVPLTTVVEHFTNTYCSICAGRNPGFYGNLSDFPSVLHIAYYPSAPYPACPFNQMNKEENDARTNYYGIYGGTPRIAINGSVLAASSNYDDPAIFQGMATQTSDYSLSVTVSRKDSLQAEAIIRIKKVAPNTRSSLLLYAVLSEDTVNFNANNGETIHYGVFHKSLTGVLAQPVNSIQAVGDSIKLTFTFSLGSGWGRTSVTALLQDSTKNVLQAARSASLPPATSIHPVICTGIPLCMYPVPARNELYLGSLPAGYHNYTIFNSIGQQVKTGVVYDRAQAISLAGLAGGNYIITIGEGAHTMRGLFVKE